MQAVLIGFVLSAKMGLDMLDPAGAPKKPRFEVTQEDVQVGIRPVFHVEQSFFFRLVLFLLLYQVSPSGHAKGRDCQVRVEKNEICMLLAVTRSETIRKHHHRSTACMYLKWAL